MRPNEVGYATGELGVSAARVVLAIAGDVPLSSLSARRRESDASLNFDRGQSWSTVAVTVCCS